MFLPTIPAKLLIESFGSRSFHIRFAYPFEQKGFVSFERYSGYPRGGFIIDDYYGGPNRRKVSFYLDLIESDQSNLVIKLDKVRVGFTERTPIESDLRKVISLILLIPEQKAEWWSQTRTPDEEEISQRDDPTICSIAKMILTELPESKIPTDSQRSDWFRALTCNQLCL